MEVIVHLDNDEYLVTLVALDRAIKELRRASVTHVLPPDIFAALIDMERTYEHLKGARITAILRPTIIQN